MNLISSIKRKSKTPALVLAPTIGTGVAAAQSVDRDRQTRDFTPPLASMAASTNNKFGLPMVACHFWNAGSMLGNLATVSITEDFGSQIDFGAALPADAIKPALNLDARHQIALSGSYGL
jgi:hypothetical protein